MRMVWFGQSACCGAAVRYYLVEDALEKAEMRYGVGVWYKDEVEILPDITLSRQSAVTLLEALARGRVTPLTVGEVVEDWLKR